MFGEIDPLLLGRLCSGFPFMLDHSTKHADGEALPIPILAPVLAGDLTAGRARSGIDTNG